MFRSRNLLLLALMAMFALMLVACGGDDDSAPATAPAAPAAAAAEPAKEPEAPAAPAAEPAKEPEAPAAPAAPAADEPEGNAAFDALLKAAQAETNTEVVGWYDGVDPDTIRAWEAAFEEEFGIDIKVNSIPGHASRDAGVQALAAYKAGKAIADDLGGNADLMLDNIEAGALRAPDWAALEGVSPLIAQYRDALILENRHGGPMNEFCMVSSFYVWPLAYNTSRVSADELKGVSFNDLAYDSKWKDRVVTDARFLGVYAFPMAPGWDSDKQVAWVKALKSNGAKAVSGGSTGVVQAILSGEGDIGIASSGVALREKKKGAPVDWYPPSDGWVPGGIGLTCFPTLTGTGSELADLWSAWQATTGAQIEADLTGSFVTAPGVINDFTQKMADNGLDLPANLVYAYKAEDVEMLGPWRQQAIDAFTE